MAAADFTFSGETQRIIITSGVTSVDVQDMYSRWKDWTTQSDNSKYFQAFRTFGGDPTIAGQFAPRYFFLTNGWRIIVDNDNDVNFATNLYTDELDPPVLVSGDSTASIFNSDAVNVESDISKALDYGGKVVINTLVGVSGTTYPAGTSALPVNNISDAVTISEGLGLDEIYIQGPLTIDMDVHDYRFIGGNIRDVITFTGTDVSGCTFTQCVLDGGYNGFISADKCILESGISGMSGFFTNCGFRGEIYVNDNSTCDFFDCASQVPGNDSPSLFLGNDILLTLRRYSGGMAFYDCRTGTTITIEYVAGNCKVLSGNTGGEIEVRGIAKLTDQSSGTTVGTAGLLIPYTVANQHSLNVNTEITKNK